LDGFEVWCNDQNVSIGIRTQACGQRASKVSSLPVVRKALLSLQYGFQRAPGLVTDGRDMGTVVFPDAKCKFFLTASLEVRAKRRYQQIIARGDEADLSVIEQELALRDQRDQERVISALKPAADAIIVDTSAMDIDAVFELALGYIE
jgi:cytidylate kinase